MHALQKMLLDLNYNTNNMLEEVIKQIMLPIEKEISNYPATISELRDIKGILLERENIGTIFDKLLKGQKFQKGQIDANLSDILFLISKDNIYTYQMSDALNTLTGKYPIAPELLDMKNYIMEFDDDDILQVIRESPENYVLALFSY